MSTAAPKTCPLCDRPPRAGLLLKNGRRLLRCPACGLGWWKWDPFDPAGFYDFDYFQSNDATRGYGDYASLEAGIRRTARARLRRIARLLPAGCTAPRLLEIGCGTGCFLDEARRLGWQVRGLEVSAWAAEQARRRGLDVTCQPAEQALWRPESCDCVVLWDTIEHLHDPVRVLERCAVALVDGGVLALSTGDLGSLCARLTGRSWHLFNLPEHLFFFTRAALRRLADRCCCEVRATVREVIWTPASYLFERVQRTVFGGQKRLPRGRAHRVFPATLLDVIGLYATRKARTCPGRPRQL